jgi:hypothetical protein
MKFLPLLGKKLKEDEVIEILEGLDMEATNRVSGWTLRSRGRVLRSWRWVARGIRLANGTFLFLVHHLSTPVPVCRLCS